MDLKITPVSRCLEKKMMIFGFEVPDLLLIFMTLSILNFLFNETDFKLLLIWLPALSLAGTLRFAKRGKPDNYLVHWLRFQIRPGVLSAFNDPTVSEPLTKNRKSSQRKSQ